MVVLIEQGRFFRIICRLFGVFRCGSHLGPVSRRGSLGKVLGLLYDEKISLNRKICNHSLT